MALDEEAAQRAIATRVAAPLNFAGRSGLDEAAQGILALGTMTMAGAIKQITIERGMDSREFALFVFGGGGPLHGAALARELGIPLVIVPPEPGIFSALGMILADARVDEARTFLRSLTSGTVAEIDAAFEEMESETRASFEEELGPSEIFFERQAEMRFHGQRHSLKVTIGNARDADVVRGRFEDTYERKYGHVETGSPVEIVSLVLTAIARLPRPELERLTPVRSEIKQQRSVSRSVYFPERGSRIETPVLQRSHLEAGFVANGPAIIEEYGSTTVVGPDDHFEIGKLGEIRIYCK
jgi:N-methylhydantoinase A